MKSEPNTPKPTTVDEYIASADEQFKNHLQTLRDTIRQTAPLADEVISYQMPAYKQNGMVVYFGYFTKHIGLYPDTEVIEKFKEELSEYQTSKGSIRFEINKPLPIDLIKKIVKYKVDSNLAKHLNQK